jgi:ribonuclease HI
MTDREIFERIKKMLDAVRLGISEDQWLSFCTAVEARLRPPEEDVFVFNIDGGSKGNPGPAGIGIVVSNADGDVLEEHYEYIGEQTNNVAEYRALLSALKLAREQKYRHILIKTDSELLARQINGEYQVKNKQLLPLYFSVQDAKADFTSFAIENIPRAENQRADRLANLAISRETML